MPAPYFAPNGSPLQLWMVNCGGFMPPTAHGSGGLDNPPGRNRIIDKTCKDLTRGALFYSAFVVQVATQLLPLGYMCGWQGLGGCAQLHRPSAVQLLLWLAVRHPDPSALQNMTIQTHSPGCMQWRKKGIQENGYSENRLAV